MGYLETQYSWWKNNTYDTLDIVQDMDFYLDYVRDNRTGIIDPVAEACVVHLMTSQRHIETVLFRMLPGSEDWFYEDRLFDNLATFRDEHTDGVVTWKTIMQAWWDAPIAGWGWTIQFIDFMRKAVWNEPMNIIEQESFRD